MTIQRRYQLRQQAKGLCTKCPRKALTKAYCPSHAIQHAEHCRRYRMTRPIGAVK